MLSLIKLLKIVLPVTTVTAATIATVSLVSFKKEDSKLGLEKEDTVLQDFEKPIEEFKEQTMLYSENGQGENVKVTEEVKKQLEGKSPEKNQNKGATISEDNSSYEASKNSLKHSEDQVVKGDPSILTPLNTKDTEVSSKPPHSTSTSDSEPANIDSPSSQVLSESEKDTLQEPSDIQKGTKEATSSDTEVKDVNIETSQQQSPNSDVEKGQDNTQPQDQNEPNQHSSVESVKSEESTKTIQDASNDSLGTTESGSQDGIQGEYGTNEISEEQIEDMIKLEEATANALINLNQLIN